MRLEQLEYLCEVAKRKSMNIASTKLYVSQQTISTAIKNLEKELDTKLLERTYHGVFPTEIGQELIDISSQLFNQLDQLKMKIVLQNNSKLIGCLNLGIDRGINMLIMPKVVSHFYKYHPNINIEIVELDQEATKEAVLNKTMDIGIVPTYQEERSALLHPDLIIVDILQFQFFARVHRDSPLVTEEAVSLRTLLNYPLAIYDQGTSGKLFHELLKKYHKPYLLSTKNLGVAQQLVVDKLAISLAVKVNNDMPALFVSHPDIVLIPIKEKLPFGAVYMIHHDNEHSPILESFIDTLVKIT